MRKARSVADRFSSLPLSLMLLGAGLTASGGAMLYIQDAKHRAIRAAATADRGIPLPAGVAFVDPLLARQVSREAGVPGNRPWEQLFVQALREREMPEHRRRQLERNLERLRALPARPGERYILVNIPSGKLWLYENGRAVDSMKVVTGQASLPTPVLFGMIRFLTLNPYWNVPPDLVRNRIAVHVLSEGPAYLAAHRFEILSGWEKGAMPVDPATVDWRAVREGRQPLRVRQLPHADNMMGRMKFMLPNPLGIYLHDTPARSDFTAGARQFSSGCVRVEDAPRLAAWLMRGTMPTAGGQPEQRADLSAPVPVYIAYLTAEPVGNGIRSLPDPYGRDATD